MKEPKNVHSRSIHILHQCARLTFDSVHHRLLVSACAGYTMWDELLNLAETEGMGPLLHRHLTGTAIDVPMTFIRGLRFLRLRHRQANTIITNSLIEILNLLRSVGIPCLVLKGAALCHTLYPQIELRPMRDIDLLFAEKDVHKVNRLLQKQGFIPSTVPIPPDHFHLPALYQSVDSLQVCVELHHNLYSPIPPYNQSPSFSFLYKNANSFDVNGTKAYTFRTEELLLHLFQHGFHAPLVFEPYKLISAADIVSLVEKEIETIDWDKIRSESPNLFNALQYFHHLTPWTDHVLAKITFTDKAASSDVGACFDGWPYRRLSDWKGKRLSKMLRHTFFPPKWWMQIYYGQSRKLIFSRYRYVRHWQHIFWWVKLLGTHFYMVTLEKKIKKLPDRQWKGFLVVRIIKVLLVAIYRQFKY